MQSDHGLQPDLIFFTGDAAFGQIGNGRGESIREQFEGAARFFDDVRKAFDKEVPLENFFLVPGNHDVNRQNVTEDQVWWLDSQADASKVLSMIHGNTLQWRRCLERLCSYRTFLEQNYPHLLQDPDRLIYALTRNVRDYKINVVGLNSAWSCCRDNEKGKLWMAARWQIEHLISALELPDLSIALMHHPSNWLGEHEDPQFGRQVERDFDFSLHGHEHQDW